MSQTPSQAASQQHMAAHMHGQPQQPTPQMMFLQQMNPATLQQLSGQSQETLLMMQQQSTRQNSGHQDGQRPREPRERLPSVYVGNLPKDYYQLDLYKHVKGLGFNVYQAIINVDKQTKRQNRYGFLQFFDAAEARRCAAELNNTQIGLNYIRCNLQEGNFMEPKANLVVKFIDLAVTQQQFYDTFLQFGPIRSCKLELFPDGKSRGFGYIQFESEEAANLAIQKSGVLEFNGKKVEILNHQRKEQRPETERSFLNLFVQGLSEGTNDEQLKAMFAEFGEIQSAYVHRGGEARDSLANKGYVSFKEGAAAKLAIEVMNKKQMPDGSYLLVSRHISKRENQVAAQSPTTITNTIEGSMRKTYESNLFVKNIPSEISEEELMSLFKEIGEVISIKMRQGKYFNPAAAYRQYFVLYKDIECAKKAIQRFDQATPFGARSLSVQFWMPTQELHQEREQRSFQEVQQYFLKGFQNHFNQFPPMHSQNPQFQGQGQNYQYGGQRPSGFQGQRGPRPDRRDGGKFNNRGGNRQNGVRQGGDRQGYQHQNQQQQQQQQQQPQIAVNQMTPEAQHQYMQQQMMNQQQQHLQGVDTTRLQEMSPADRRQEVGNTIYQIIQQQYGEAAGKITGMLLDNERIVDQMRLVSDINYLAQKAMEAWTLLQQQQYAEPGMVEQQMLGQ